MADRPWRERVAAEDEVQRQLRNDMSASGRRRAEALRDGVKELKSNRAVARDLGISETAVRNALAALSSAATEPGTTTE
ncbi:MAG TPA: hypothetical protein VK659_09710 [Asanoa sp.]|nr:hypothetical protein [Asanoa sp.]